MTESQTGRRILTAGETFCFACNPQVDCFTNCCKNADMYLYPYDVIRLKRRLGMSSGEFLDKHTYSDYRDNEFFPSVMLRMSLSEDLACPFLSAQGCMVYEDRPFSCRAYPLEPAVSRAQGYYHVAWFLARHSHCHGHGQGREWTVQEWIENQQLAPYNEMNGHWVAVDTLFRKNPWGAQGVQGPALKMASMACFDMDRFRDFVFKSSFLERFSAPPESLEKARESDEGLMLLGFEWVKSFLSNSGSIRPKG